jgi:hypothetical protein
MAHFSSLSFEARANRSFQGQLGKESFAEKDVRGHGDREVSPVSFWILGDR